LYKRRALLQILFNELQRQDTRIYVIIAEKNNPHVPIIAALAEAAKQMTAEEKAFTRARIKTLNAYTSAVTEALGHAASA
jgi:hypothetical protein